MGKRGRGPGPWEKELDDALRAFSGAFLFGIPLLFTMEMWWIATYIEWWKLMLFLAAAFAVNVHLAYFAGFKRESTFASSVGQAVECLAVGVVGAAVVLLTLDQINTAQSLESSLSKVALQAVPLSIGASVANIILAAGGEEGRQGSAGPQRSLWRRLANDVGATIAGGLFLGFPVAPTDEIPMLAAGMTFGHELALAALTLLVSYIIVFESGFSPQLASNEQTGPFQRPFTETALAYVVSLLVALAMLILFDRITPDAPLQAVVSQTLVLGLPTAVGGAAGRLVI